MTVEGPTEQHFILRVQDAELAGRLRSWLRDTANINEPVRLLFEQDVDRAGVLVVDGQEHQVVLQDLPTVVESYKTLDDANLVKVADIGQVLVVVDPALGAPDSYESQDGVTPPMRKARGRHFRPRVTLPADNMRAAVEDVLELLAGRAPDGYAFHDVEEEYVVDPATGRGRWQPVKPAKPLRGAAAGGAGGAEQQQQAAAAAASKRAGRAARRGGKGGDSDYDEMSDGE